MPKRAWLLLLASLLAACGPASDDRGPETDISVSRVLSSQLDPGFARAERVRRFEFPGDHGPHPEYATEWWYFTGNLRDETGRRFGYQLTLFRVGLKPMPPETDSSWRSHQVYMGHLAVSDIDQQAHHSEERFSRAAAGLAGAGGAPLRVWLGPWSLAAAPDSFFPLRLEAAGDDLAIELSLAQGIKPVVLQGDRGLSRKGVQAGNAFL